MCDWPADSHVPLVCWQCASCWQQCVNTNFFPTGLAAEETQRPGGGKQITALWGRKKQPSNAEIQHKVMIVYDFHLDFEVNPSLNPKDSSESKPVLKINSSIKMSVKRCSRDLTQVGLRKQRCGWPGFYEPHYRFSSEKWSKNNLSYLVGHVIY